MASVTSWTATAIQNAINALTSSIAAKADLAGGLLLDSQLPVDVITTSSLTTALTAKADLVGGVVPDTQAAAISMKRGELFVNVKDKGATGNGTTADDTALLAAIAAVPGTGGIVLLPPGSYLLNGAAALALATTGTVIQGSGVESTKIVIGSGFTGPAAIQINAKDCMVRDLTITGANTTTTTSNPVCDGIKVNGVRRVKVDNVNFWNINGWAIEDLASTTDSSGNPDGSILTRLMIRNCAGGVRFLGNTISGYALNSFMSNVDIVQCGVTTGASANLDGVRVEDSWDVLLDGVMTWMGAGTGSSLHVKGNCAAVLVQNLDAFGTTTGPTVLIEDSTNGSPQNVQIDGGVIQQGSIGLRVTGGASHVHLRTLRVINSRTHGLSIEGTGGAVHCLNLFFSTNGAGASGTNYDVNWSGSSTGYMDDCRFATSIVASGTAGVQMTVAIAAAQIVRFINAVFTGTGSTSANWFTNTPSGVIEVTTGAFNFVTTPSFSNPTTAFTAVGPAAMQPSASTGVALSTNVSGGDVFDRYHLTADGAMSIGSGAAARDTTNGRAGAGVWYVKNNLLVGASAPLGDNGVVEIQLADATTVPTTNPTGGVTVYSQSASGSPLKMRDTAGNVRGLVPSFAYASAQQSNSTVTQAASTALVIAVEASATYEMEAMLVIQSPTGVSFVNSFTGPTGATMIWGDTTATYMATITTQDTWSGNGANKIACLKGTLITSTTAGSLTVTFASGTAANAALLQAGSFLKLTRVK